MKTKKKAKIEKAIFSAVTMICFGVIGAMGGVYISALEDRVGKEMEFYQMLLSLVLFALLAMVFYMVNIYLHELGHMLFGLLTGYRFSSIRFGSLMFVKSNGKLKVKRFKLAGTGGQALMLAPEGDSYDYPIVLYNMGGLIVNFATGLIGVVCFALIPDKLSVIAGLVLLLAVLAFVCFITNILPLTELGTDGANTLILHKSKEARLAFRKTLEINKLLVDNVPFKDMPKELFAYDKEIKLDNPLVTSLAINRFSYLLMEKEYEQAKELGTYILENASSINYIHVTAIKAELIFVALMIENDNQRAKELFEQEKKMIQKLSALISIQRLCYAYYSLCEVDEKKAANAKKMFEQLSRHYPFEADLVIEKEYLAMIDEKLTNA